MRLSEGYSATEIRFLLIALGCEATDTRSYSDEKLVELCCMRESFGDTLIDNVCVGRSHKEKMKLLSPEACVI